MTEAFDDRIIHAAREYRLSAEPPIDEIWDRVEAVRAAERRYAVPTAADRSELRTLPELPTVAGAWRRPFMVAAVAMIFAAGWLAAVLAGRALRRDVPPTAMQFDYARITLSGYLASSDSLLSQFTTHAAPASPAELEARARRLIARSRLMEDVFRNDSTISSLLRDLDLILVQIAQYAASPQPASTDVFFINDAIAERHVAANLRSVQRRMGEHE
jgi:hypothetical protein